MGLIHLYSATSTSFDDNGTPLVTAREAVVKRDEGFQLTFSIPISQNELHKRVQKEMIVSAMTPDGVNYFRIWDIEKRTTDVKVTALQLLYSLDVKQINPFGGKQYTGDSVLRAFINSFKSSISPYTFSSSIVTQRDFYTNEEDDTSTSHNALAILNKITDNWSGELMLNGFDVRMISKLGTKTDALLYEHKNIASFSDSSSMNGIVTRIYATATYTPERAEGAEEDPEPVILTATVDSPLIDQYAVVYEATMEYNDARTVAELRTEILKQYSEFNVDKPERTIDVETNIVDGTAINFGDELVLKYLLHDVDEVIRCVGYEYDPISENYIGVTLGTLEKTFLTKVTEGISSAVTRQIDKINKQIQIVQTAANGKNRVTYGPNPVPNPIEGDLWFHYPEGRPDEITLLIYQNGQWLPTPFLTDRDKQDAIDASNQALIDAKAHAEAGIQATKDRFDALFEEVELDVADAQATANSAVEQIDIAVANAGFTSLDDTIQNMKDITSGVKNELDTAIENAGFTSLDDTLQNMKDITSGVKSELDTAIENAGFTSLDETIQNVKGIASGVKSELDIAVQNAGFTSLDETIQNMSDIASGVKSELDIAVQNAGFTSLDEVVSSTRYLGETAKSNAQSAISEAQTAQAKSLEALGKADNALDGVSNLDIRVDEVEGELELKADNAFMTEDGELITLSNAITINADRFSSDMQRIESRVESLAGEINLVILKDVFEGTRLVGNETYPNPSTGSQYGSSDTMREMIAVEEGEQLAFSKQTVTIGYSYWSYNYYDDNYNYIGRRGTSDNEHILTVPSGVSKIWVSYPKGSQPQIVRGTTFVPYRPNLADQMTTDEIRIFRNEYDEFAEGTQRRITAIDSAGGRLETAETLITQTAEGLSTTVGRVDDQEDRIATVEHTAEGLQTTVANKASISQVTQIAEGLDVLVKSKPKSVIPNGDFSDRYTGWSFGSSISDTTISNYGRVQLYVSGNLDTTSNNINRIWSNDRLVKGKTYKITFDAVGSVVGQAISVGQVLSDNIQRIPLSKTLQTYEVIYKADVDNSAFSVFFHRAGTYSIGNFVVVETSAVSQTQVSVLSDSITSTVSSLDGRVTEQKQTLDSISTTVYDEHEDKIATQQITLDGLQTTVADKANQSQVTQLASGLNALVQNKPKSIALNGDFSIGSNGTSYWTMGTDIDFYTVVENRARVWLNSSSQSTSGSVNRLFNNGRFLSGRKYRVTFDAFGALGSTSITTKDISIGQSDSTRNQKVTITETLQSYEVIYHADRNGPISFYLHDWGQYEIGNIEVVETNQVSQAQISVLSDSITSTVSSLDGRITEQKQTLESISSTVSGHGGRISTVEQTAQGLQSTVADKANQSQVTQLSTGLNTLVRNKPKSIALNGDFSIGSTGRSYWTFGTDIDFYQVEENRARMWLHSNNQSTSGILNRMFNNGRFLSGRKYRVTFDAITAHGATTTKEISVGTLDSTRNQKVTVTETLNSYEIIYHADRNGPISFYLHDWGQYEIGNIVVVETNQVSQAQFSVLNNSITQSVTDLDGRVSVHETTLGSISSTVYDEHEDKIATQQLLIDGLQTTVADKANQSQVTQLSSAYNVLVRSKPKSVIPNGDFSDGYTGWSFGTNISVTKNYGNGLTELYIAGNLETTTNNINRIWTNARLEKDKTYKITFDATGSVDGQAISVGQALSDNMERISLSKSTKSYEVIYQADVDNSAFSVFFHRAGTYAIGNFVVVETSAMSQAQFSVLSDSITSTVSDLDGKVSAHETTLGSISSTVYDDHADKIATHRTTIEGIQSTVASKANQSEVTQLSNAYNVLVRSKPTSVIPNGDFSDGYTGWSFGSSISGTTISNYGRIQLTVSGNLDTTTNNVNRVWSNDRLEKGKTYKITFDAVGSVVGQAISIGQGLSDNIQRIPLSKTLQTYEVIYQADRDNSPFSVFFHRAGTYSIGNFVVVETSAVTKSQLSVLENNINLRVTKGEVVSQINITAEGILLDGGKTHITGKTTIDDAVIKSAHIKELDAEKITTGTIDSDRIDAKYIVTEGLESDVIKAEYIKSEEALIDVIFSDRGKIDYLWSKEIWSEKISAITIDVGKITGETADFISAGFKAVNSQATINGNAIRIQNTAGEFVEMNNVPELRSDDAGGTAVVLGKGRVHFYDSRGYSKGYVGTDMHTAGSYDFGTFLSKGSGIYKFARMADATQTTYAYYTVKAGLTAPASVITNMVQNGYLPDGNPQQFVAKGNMLSQLNGWPNYPNWPTLKAGQQIRYKELTAQTTGDAYEDIWKFGPSSAGDWRIYFAKHATFEGGTTGTSDRRLKHDIETTQIEALHHIESLTFKEFRWNRDNKYEPIGLIAQDSGIIRVADDDMEGIDIQRAIMLGLKGVQELNELAKAQAEEIRQLKEIINQ